LTTTPSTLGLGGKLSGTVTVTASNLPGTGTPRTVSAWLCIDSNDANTPVLAVPVTATQN
jgi:hypothetical protein